MLELDHFEREADALEERCQETSLTSRALHLRNAGVCDAGGGDVVRVRGEGVYHGRSDIDRRDVSERA